MDNFFEELDYRSYCEENGIHRIKGIDVELDSYGDLLAKKTKKWESINPSNDTPFPPELDDLIRLHYLVRSRRVRTVMEFGVGKSTYTFLDALAKNRKEFEDEVSQRLRCSNPFELHSIENNKGWLNIVTKTIGANLHFHPHLCPVSMGTFNDRVCTYYDSIPNIRPDLIYIDGPDQFSPGGSVRGISTNHPDRMPMMADVLAIEHFLEPGALIIIDGRAANARFLKCNFQRNWQYLHLISEDQHFFELIEEPLGKWNKAALDFSKE